MFSRSLISIDEVLSELDLVRLLETFGVEVVNSSLKSFFFDGCGSSNLQNSLSTYITSNKYTIQYLGREFTLSYSTVEEDVTESGGLGLSKTYICVLTAETSLDLLEKLAQYFNVSIETGDFQSLDLSNRFIRNLL